MAALKVHLVDGTFELFRAYYGAPSMKSPSGREVGASRTLARSLLRLIDDGATHVGFAFDRVIESFRNDLWQGYKTSAGIEPELWDQFELAERVAAALGFVVWPMVEFEADDALATFAARAAADPNVAQVRICSPDKDLAQCVSEDRVVLVDRLRKKEHDQRGVEEKFGVSPESIPDWLALVGDDADGIPGVPKWGKKSAATLLSVYRTVERIPDREQDWSVQIRGASSLAASLREHRDLTPLFRTLATLRRDVPLSEGIEELEWRGPDREALSSLAGELGDDELIARAESSGYR
jgi:5'-3' exonuclease